MFIRQKGGFQMEFQKFLEGNSFDAYEYFGVHIERNGAVFRIYAPKAKKVELQGVTQECLYAGFPMWRRGCIISIGLLICREEV